MTASAAVRADLRTYLAVALVSAAVIALQLVLMRCLAVARWHHFAYFVISTALLGFGASGTFLAFVGPSLVRRFSTWLHASCAAFALATPSCLWLAERLPIDTYQILLQPGQAGLLIVYHLLMVVPFFFGAVAIGLSLTACRDDAAKVYAANLVGSGLGSAWAIGLMVVLRPEELIWAVAATGMVAGALVASRSRYGLGGWVAGLGVLGTLGVLLHGPMPIDPYKSLASFEQLIAQGQARRVARMDSPRGRLDLIESPLAHQTLFASPHAEPPPKQRLLFLDGGNASPIFRIDSADEAAVLDETPMAAVYRLLRPRRILLISEVGGANVWLARRFGAESITVVQPNPQVTEILSDNRDGSRHVFAGADVDVVHAEPRGFLEQTDQKFDLIQLTGLESLSAGAPGMTAMSQSYLATVEGIARCLDRLSAGGVVAVVRGISEPPRDNVRLYATFATALEFRGLVPADERLVQFRNYLAACTMASRDALSDRTCRRLQSILTDMAMDPVWYPGMAVEAANRIDPRPGPEGTPLSHLGWCAREILSKRREALYEQWAFAIRPATDDRPFFHHFFRWGSLSNYVDAFGRQWLVHLEWGYVMLVAALVWLTIAAAVLIPLPLALRRGERGGRGYRWATGAYFFCLGLAYMLLEITLMQDLTHVLAEPVFAVAVVLAAFLVCSGVGSFLAGRKTAPARYDIARPLAMIVLLGVAYVLVVRPALSLVLPWPLAARACVCLAAAGVLALPMGMPFPRGLQRLNTCAPQLIPWAWGANGFASVIAAVLAVVLAMSMGFTTVVCIALVVYIVAGLVSMRLPIVERSSGLPAAG